MRCPASSSAGSRGEMVKAMGYSRFFAATALIGVPVALLCLIVWRRQAGRRFAPAPQA